MGRFRVFKLIMLLLVLFINNLFSQSYLAKNYTEADGLGSSQVYDIAQDSLGQIWFATEAGITVYDGLMWKTYNQVDGLFANAQLKITVDEKGRIWVINNINDSLAINYLDDKKWKKIPSIQLPRKNYKFTALKIVKINEENCIIVGTRNCGLFVYKNNVWINITEEKGLFSNQVFGVVVIEDEIFIATDKGLSVLREEKIDNSLNKKLQLPSSYIYGIASDCQINGKRKQPKIWLVGLDWYGYLLNNNFYLVKENIKTWHFEFNKKEQSVFSIDNSGGLFIGNKHEMYYISSENTIEPFKKITEIPAEAATSFLIDREKNVWIATLRGVTKIVSRTFRNYYQEDPLLSDEVTAIESLKSGGIVFGHNNGISIQKGNKVIKHNFSNNKNVFSANTRVLDLAVDKNGDIWAAVSKLGLLRIRNLTEKKWFQVGEKNINVVTSVLLSNDGFLMVLSQEGLFKYENSQFESVVPPKKYISYFRKLFKGKDDSIIIATLRKGVLKYSNGTWKQFNHANTAANNVYAFFRDSRGRSFVGTRDGLYIIKNDSLIKFVSDNFKINNSVYLIFEDHKNRLWFGTNFGIYRWDGQTSRHYTISDGLSGNEINRSAGYVAPDGKVWVGTDKGVSCYQEEFDFIRNVPPLVHLEGLKVNNVNYDLSQPIDLKHSENDLIFQFRGISFVDEKSIEFETKLTGYDEEWVLLPNSFYQQARYTSLLPGKYRFHVRVKNAAGIRSKDACSSDIIIKKPFWEKWWFYLIWLLALALVVLIFFRLIMQRRYSYKLEKQVLERTNQLKDSEQQYRTTIDSMGDAIHVIDEDFKIVLFNHKFYSWNKELGLDTDVIGKSIFEVFSFVKENVRKEYEEVFYSGKVKKTVESINLGNKNIVTDTTKIPVFEGDKVVRVVTIIRDITQQKKAEQELAKTQALLLAALEQSPAGIIVADAPDAKIRLANSVALFIRGKSKKALTDIPFQLHPEHWQMYQRNGKLYKPDDLPLTNAVLHGKASKNVTSIIRNEEGEERYVLSNAAPVRDENGNIIAGVLVFSDISEIRLAGEKIERSLQEKEVLLKEVHHRVKNNLQVIISLLHLQSNYVKDEKSREMFIDSQDRVRSMALVHEKLYQSTDLANVDFGEYIKSLANSLFRVHHINPNKVRLILNVEKIPVIMKTAIPCGLIINELISNSLKYAFPESWHGEQKIEVSLFLSGEDDVELIVRDSGVGLPKNVDFRNAESLGLTLVTSLAENQLEGSIDKENENGTAFKIKFRKTTSYKN